MSSPFERDERPGAPRILFIGPGESSHTHAWVDLLAGADFNVRLFSLPQGSPPDSWPVKTYVTTYGRPRSDSATRAGLYTKGRARRFFERAGARLRRSAWDPDEYMLGWLAEVVRSWRPHVVHTLALEPSAFLYHRARSRYGLAGAGVWVAQTRGGSDLALTHLDPAQRERVAEVMRASDYLLFDNSENFRIARALGVPEEKFADIAPVPGTGGIDVDALAARRRGPSSASRLILWPKAYECPWSKALPVFEALKLCWERIQPCEVEMLALHAEARDWYWTLPAHIRERCRAQDRVPRERALELMTRARVMLAPTLVDGVPNSMYEAMAAGALPILSPLDTIRPVVEEGRNVLFARNLYPDEIAAALVRAMTDDGLVDAVARENLALVRRLADREQIRARVIDFYRRAAARD